MLCGRGMLEWVCQLLTTQLSSISRKASHALMILSNALLPETPSNFKSL